MLTKLQFKPGVNREVSSYSNEGGWVDCNRIRFRFGFPEKIGGWDKLSENTYLGTCRSLNAWNSLRGDEFIGVGTHLKFYIQVGGAYQDITPIREVKSGVTFSATTGSSEIEVTNTDHGALANDFVTFSGAVSLGGQVTADVLNAEHQITEIIDADTYVISVSVVADGSDTGNGGGSTDGTYQINTGLDTTVGGNGFGAGTYARATWGSSTPINTVDTVLRYWTQDNFGEDLIYNVSGDAVYYWDTSASTVVEPYTRGVVLTELGRESATVAASQTPGGAGSLTLTSGTVTLSPSQFVVIEGTGDESSVTFTITGTDINGDAQTETLSRS